MDQGHTAHGDRTEREGSGHCKTLDVSWIPDSDLTRQLESQVGETEHEIAHRWASEQLT